MNKDQINGLQMNEPLVSLICICKNRSNFIRRCLESVLSQNYDNFEFLIQDGASTDGTVEIIKEYHDERIKLISEPDSGAGDAFVKAIQRIKGDIWGSCLSDEELLPHAISWAVENFNHYPDAAAIYGDYYTTDAHGTIVSANKAQQWNFKKYLCCEIVPPFCSSFFRSSHFKTIGYNSYNNCGEYDLWLRLGMRYPIYYCEGLISKFATHEGSKTSQVSDYYKTLPGRIQAVETLVAHPNAPQDIVSLKDEGIAGIHLWMAQNFLWLGAINDFKNMIGKSFEYKPNESRLCAILQSYLEQMNAAGKLQEAVDFINTLKTQNTEPGDHIIDVSLGHNDSVDCNDMNTALRPLLNQWITAIAKAENRLYYRDQTVDSLLYLVDMVNAVKPDRIVELGTLSGLSLRTWRAAAPATPVTAIDLSFQPLMHSREIMPLDLTNVTLLEQDILTVDFASLWQPDERMILYIDAHDLSGVPIMQHLLDTAIPSLPLGSLVVVDDVWYSPETLDQNSADRFFREVVINEIDPLQCFDGYYASYWKGGSFFGFLEVIPLLEWVNNNRIELAFKPGIKSVAFTWGGR